MQADFSKALGSFCMTLTASSSDIKPDLADWRFGFAKSLCKRTAVTSTQDAMSQYLLLAMLTLSEMFCLDSVSTVLSSIWSSTSSGNMPRLRSAKR